MSRSLAWAALLAQVAVPSWAADEALSRYDFGTVSQGTQLEHQFPLRNDGSEALRIAGVQLTPPLQLAKMPAVIAPGATGNLKLSLDTSKVEGEYNGQLLVILGGQSAPRAYSFVGKVVAGIEILPRPAFFISTPKGTAKTESLEIVNHERDPLALSLKPVPTAMYQARLETVEAGRRFRLSVTVPASAPAGRISERLELASSSAAKPMLPVGLNVIVRERVYTFPDVVDFGQLKQRDTGAGSSALNTQTLMVYQTGGKDFRVQASSAIAGLELGIERGAQGDRVQITASLGKARKAAGPVSGSIVLTTNDKQFPRIEVPVTGSVLAD